MSDKNASSRVEQARIRQVDLPSPPTHNIAPTRKTAQGKFYGTIILRLALTILRVGLKPTCHIAQR